MKRNKQGISLIVLVITIIVMIILAAAVILALNNSNIIERADEAVNKTDMAQIQELASIAWTEAYADGKKTQAELKAAVMDSLKANGYSDATLNKYDIIVTTEDVEITVKGAIPDEWKTNVTAIVDTVPIPKGFVASPYAGENTKDAGLVIYELKSGETAIPSSETHQTSLTTRNQYVWIPVDKTTFSTTFVRQNFGMGYTISTAAELGTDYWEVVPTTDETTDINKQYLVQGTTLAEVQAMYASVKEYGGFYIARYEAGIDTERKEQGTAEALLSTVANVHSKMGKIPYIYIPWTWNNVMNEEANGAVSVARSLYPNDSNTTGVVSTLTYGVQWDAAVEWLRTNGKDINGNAIESVTTSTAYGNYMDHEIKAGDLNKDAQYWNYTEDSSGSYAPVTYDTDGSSTNTKNASTAWALSTGALKAAKVNNIYDMAGNVWEWTMEGRSSLYRVFRGGAFTYVGGYNPLARRNYATPYDAISVFFGFRPSLYIKK